MSTDASPPRPRRVAARAVGGLLALAVVISTVLVGTVTAHAPGATLPPTISGGVQGAGGVGLPESDDLTMPVAVPAAGTDGRRLLAHYFPPYPVSFENGSAVDDYYGRNYLNPHGEQDKHLSVGGLLRDRPEVRARRSGDWRTADFLSEIDAARASGVDGFLVNVLSLPSSNGNWDRTVGLFSAAETVSGFTVNVNIDPTGSVGDIDPETIADTIAPLVASSAAWRLADGRVVLSSFKVEEKPVGWWSAIMDRLRDRWGVDTAFIAVFLDASTANLTEYAPITWTAGNWGVRTARSIAAAPDRAAVAHSLGLKWLDPIAVQDARPNQGRFAEAGNTEALRAAWTRAIGDGSDFAQLITWNDYSESTTFAPSVAHGTSFLRLSSYYAAWYKTGGAPPIAHDTIVLTHRIQPAAAVPSEQERIMTNTLEGNPPAPRDTIEVVCLLTAPGTVTIRAGGRTTVRSVPAGLSAVLVPLRTGRVSASVRSGGTTMRVDSPWLVGDHPTVQDLQYYAVSAVAG